MDRKFGTIFEIGDCLVSEEVITEYFACDYEKCKGCCCIIGDSGAPLKEEEIAKIEEAYPSFSPLMQETGRKVVDEKGKETTVTKTVEVVDPNAIHSIYSVVFCEGNSGWTRNAELNKVFLIQQQNYANDKLKLNGVLTLNEVYDMIGAPRTAYGQIAGWVYTDDSSIGDNFVDFGIFDVNNEKACDFVNGYEKSIILDFNCIGNILEYI